MTEFPIPTEREIRSARRRVVAAIITFVGVAVIAVSMSYLLIDWNHTRDQLTRSQCGLARSRVAIEAFHRQDYASAVQLYTNALDCDPNSAYLLNLKAYSLFKLNKVDEALEAQRLSIKADPQYAWGYFDLARFLCATRDSGKLTEAKAAIGKAIELDSGLKKTMEGDGEVRRLCGEWVP